jgi:hypothetical protein
VLLLLITLLVIQLVSFDEDDSETVYIPKSKQNRLWRYVRPTIRTWTNDIAQAIESSINGWSTDNRNRTRIINSSARESIFRTPKKRGTTIISMLAFAAVAMQAHGTGSYYDESMVLFDTDSATIGVDNRCTGCISNRVEDFDGPLVDSHRTIKGFGGSKTRGVKIGTIVWEWVDDNGQTRKFRIPKSFYVPEGGVRLLSPQHWAQTQKDFKPIQGTGSTTDAKSVTLFWNQRKNKLTIPLGRGDNVASFHLASGYTKFAAFCAQAETDYEKEQDNPLICQPAQVVSDDEDDTDNEDDAYIDSGWDQQQRNDAEADSGSEQFQHAPNTVTLPPTTEVPVQTEFDLNGITTQGVPVVVEDEEDRQPTNLAAELLRHHHKFGHTSFAKLQEMAKLGIIPKRLAKCPIPTCSACLYAKATKRKWRSRTSNNHDEAQAPPQPGHCVSVDQLVSPTPGLVAQMIGFLTKTRYKYATIYVDQASRLSFVYLQKTASADETLKGKEAFELYARERGITIRAYHADNGIFKAHKWVLACRSKGQSLTFAGVNAHHMNGIAERRIRSLQELARTMLIHANRRWPKAVTANLWPYALRMANDVMNETPSMQNKDRRSPQQIFSRTNVQPNPKHWKPFGCPVYVLDSALQSGRGIFHKWKARSKVGIYLGRSPQHARSIALVLDRDTALVSPQFHVVFDPSFHTCKQDEFDSRWQLKAGFIAQREPVPAINPTTNEATRNIRPRPQEADKAHKRQRRETNIDRQEELNNVLQHHELATPVNPEPRTAPTVRTEDRGSSGTTRTTRTSGGRSQPIERLIEVMMAEVRQTSSDVEGEIFCLEAMYPITQEQEHSNPLLAYKASADPDTMYLHEAMKEPDRQQFVAAMDKEVKDQMGPDGNKNFSIIHRSSVPEGATILPTVWQMKRKRDIKTRKVKKWKARLNIDGSRMEKGKHYWETYAPVASWQSIRLLLILSALHSWHTVQLDFVLAFPQAPVETDLYMSIPKGFDIEGENKKDYVLKLHRNVYGQKQAGRVWNKYLVNKLVKELKFKQSQHDECIFYRGKTMYALYTDDSILAGPDQSEIDQIIKEMKQVNLDITVEGDLQDFLGVNIEKKSDGIHLTQPHLIDQILKDLRLDDDNVTTRSTPACSSRLLSRHTDSDTFDESFKYRSVIGKLNYLEKSTRSDIAYITHQCARFSTDPKQEHGQALRWLGRYLKKTRDKGTILRPNGNKDMEVFVDADFSGNWDAKESQHSDTARSRHGYIIMYAGCPVSWKSQLQTEIALSSTESEYTGLSYALRDAIQTMELLKEMKKLKFPIQSVTPRIHCKVFEDNSGALEIATVHKYRPRTKHLNVKLHHFRDYIDRKEITIHHIHTSMQLADYLTKPVNQLIMEKLRLIVMGW